MSSEDKVNVPFVEGEELELECISTGKKGDGVFKHNGFIVMVPGAEVGSTYLVRVTKIRSTVAFGEIAE